MKENAVLFGKAESLVGIITDPAKIADSDPLPAVIILDSGLVHRVGHNRLYVGIARQLAAMGFVVFRFDFSGSGDSGVRSDHLPFKKSAISETQEAMDYLCKAKGCERFVLMGICSGAAISYKTAICDTRVVGAILINARNHLHGDDENLTTVLKNRTLARHYWRIAFNSSFRTKNWGKAITGKVDYRSILKVMLRFPLRSLFLRNDKDSPVLNEALANLRLLSQRGTRQLIVHSEGDEGLDYLHLILGKVLNTWAANGNVKLEIIQGANHIFTLLWTQDYLLKIIQDWAQEIVEVGYGRNIDP